MKKILRFMIAGLASLALFGCSDVLNSSAGNDSDTDFSRAVADSDRTKTITVHLYGAASGTWNVWAWRKSSPEANYSTKSWPGGDIVLAASTTDTGLETSFKIDPNYNMGILFVKKSGSPQTSDVIVKKADLAAYSDFYFNYDETTYYTSAAACLGLKSASIASKECDKIKALVVGYTVTEDMFTVTGNDGTTEFTVSSVSQSGTTVTLTLESGDSAQVPYTVTFDPDGDGEVEATTATAAVSVSLLDEMGLTYDGDDLGVTLNDDGTATFKAWSPIVDSANVLLYADSTTAKSSKEADIAERISMVKDAETGVWTAANVDFGSNKYYKYEFVTGTGDNVSATQVADIWSYCAAGDSVASQITDINSDADSMPDDWETSYTNPFGDSGNETTTYNDAVIYEMHIRDWSRAFVTDSYGKYLDLANSEKFMNHLKDIGVTHVQIIPVFDHAETNSSTAYNWGYNPYHYNVPEGRYVTKGYTDGTQAVKEFRTLIQKLHENGIAVNMDVVYNHTSGTGTSSLYDKTVNQYFYRLTSSGSYSNGSGCGNELATNHVMVKKYVIDSLKHWMKDYHINGFRFDLMGCLEASTMKDIYDELYAIDPNVMVYGEPWTGGTSAVEDGATSAGVGTTGQGYGAFDDDFRDAIKGAEYGGFQHGQVQGTYNDSAILKGLLGEVGKNKRNSTNQTGLALHYAECHDNYTLFDKLAMSYLNVTTFSGDLFEAIGTAGLAEVKKEDELAAAYLFLSQGTPFINGGQEFLRTKQGNENSYNASDTINQIDLSMKSTYSDVFTVYRGLIAFRKDFNAIRHPTDADAETLSTGVTKYTLSDASDSFEIYFNATDSAASIDAVTGKVVDFTHGTLAPKSGMFGAGINSVNYNSKVYSIASAESTVKKVPAKSFVVIKK